MQRSKVEIANNTDHFSAVVNLIVSAYGAVNFLSDGVIPTKFTRGSFVDNKRSVRILRMLLFKCTSLDDFNIQRFEIVIATYHHRHQQLLHPLFCFHPKDVFGFNDAGIVRASINFINTCNSSQSIIEGFYLKGVALAKFDYDCVPVVKTLVSVPDETKLVNDDDYQGNHDDGERQLRTNEYFPQGNSASLRAYFSF